MIYISGKLKYTKLIMTALNFQCPYVHVVWILTYIFNSRRKHICKHCDLTTEIFQGFFFFFSTDVDFSACVVFSACIFK